MVAAHKYMDRAWIKQLTGAELLLLRLRYGKSVSSVVETELNRRAHIAYADLPFAPSLAATPSVTPRRRKSRTKAA